MHGNKYAIQDNKWGKVPWEARWTIASIMTFLSTTIALHTRYIFLSIAFNLLFLGNTTLCPTVLRGARTLLELPTSTILITFIPISLNKNHIRRTEHFRMFFLYSEVTLDFWEGL